MCEAAYTPCRPPRTASASINAYHATPSPNRLIVPKTCPTARRAPQRLAATHRRWSNPGSSNRPIMSPLHGKTQQLRFEIGDDRVRRQRGDADTGVLAQRGAQYRIHAERIGGADEAACVVLTQAHAAD